MLVIVALVILLSLIVFSGVQSVYAALFLRKVRRPSVLSTADELKVAVILCLRGSDPFLTNCIRSLLDLDYERYELFVIIDHPKDPAAKVVKDVLANDLNNISSSAFKVQYLQERLPTCSLKCSSLVQIVTALDPSFDVIAQVDADTIVHPEWLHELVAPFEDPNVEVATGNRWYMPDEISCGSMIRSLWNASAVIQMCLFDIPWGGTLAVRTSLIHEAELVKKWSRGFCEDTMLAKIVHDRGNTIAFVPSLIMVNRESTGLEDFYSWVSRQLLTARLYHKSWPLVASYGTATSCLLIAALVTTAIAIGWQNHHAALLAGGGFLIYQVCNMILLWRTERAIRQTVAVRGQPTDWISLTTAFRIPIYAQIAQVVYQLALIRAAFVKRVSWRGAEYSVTPDGAINLISDTPYQCDGGNEESKESL